LHPIELGEGQPRLLSSPSAGARVFHDYAHEVSDFEGFIQDDFPTGHDDADMPLANHPDPVPRLPTDSPANLVEIGSDDEEMQISPP